MRDALNAVLKFATHDRVISGGILVLSLLAVLIGALHLTRIFGESPQPNEQWQPACIDSFHHRVAHISWACGRLGCECQDSRLGRDAIACVSNVRYRSTRLLLARGTGADR